MHTINGIHVKEGNQSQGAFQVITAQQAGEDNPGSSDEAVTGYIYETDQERGFVCVIKKGSQVCLYSNVMPLKDAQAWATDEINRIAAGSGWAAKA